LKIKTKNVHSISMGLFVLSVFASPNFQFVLHFLETYRSKTAHDNCNHPCRLQILPIYHYFYFKIHLHKMSGPHEGMEMRNIDFFEDNSSDDGDSMILGANHGVRVPKTRNFSHKQQPEEYHVVPETPVVGYANGNENTQKKIAPPRPPRSPPVPTIAHNSGRFTSPENCNMHDPGTSHIQDPATSSTLLHVGAIRERMAKAGHSEATEPTGTQEALVGGVSKADKIINVHATTLEALLRSEREEQLASTLCDSLAVTAPRGSIVAVSSNRLSIVQPSIDNKSINRDRTTASTNGIFRNQTGLSIRKSFLRQSRISVTSEPNEALLVLTLQPRRNSTCQPRFTDIRIPANLDIKPAIPVTPNSLQIQSEKHFDMVDFDDAYFFRHLRTAHARLAGWPRLFFSARKLHRINIISTDPAMSPRSPLAVAASGLVDTFSEANFMRHYKSPRLGKSQYTWVHWAHRFASTPTHLLPPAPPPTSAPRVSGAAAANTTVLALSGEDSSNPSPTHISQGLSKSNITPSGAHHDLNFTRLEFVHGWAVRRILVAVSLIGALSVAGALVWIFEGATPDTGNIGFKNYGFKNAGQKIADGCLIGILGMLVGWTLLALWALVSWLCD
jgi:hypothetical protein